MKNDRIKVNFDACLTDVHVSPVLHDKIMRSAVRLERQPLRAKSHKLVVAIAMILALLMTTAAAITILELVRGEMQPVKEFIIELTGHDDWLLEDKLYYVDLMESWGFELNQDKLAKLRSGEGTEDEQEQLASEIIWDCIAAHMLAVYGETIDPANEPEPYPIPSTRTMFEMLWLKSDPTASLAEIHAAHDEWFAELHAALPKDTPVPPNMTAEQKKEAILKHAHAYMADVMSMSRKEREASEVSLEFDRSKGNWKITVRVRFDDLRQVTRDWFEVNYQFAGREICDKDEDAYTYVFRLSHILP